MPILFSELQLNLLKFLHVRLRRTRKSDQSAVASLKWNKEMKNFYSRLTAEGKPPKVALVAVMGKLIVFMNTIAVRQTPWTEKNLMI